ncbi:MAG: M56 family metallopeptidase [Bacteroidota bacterium]|nr:M56 family metallopeptidase [Bacteroidota bacterium]
MNFAALQHSVFLQALGNAILNSLWQGLLLWIIYETVIVFYKTANSGFKNKLSTLLIFISFAWFLGSFVSGIFTPENISSKNLAPNPYLITEVANHHQFSFQAIFSYAAGSLPYLSISYIFLLIFLMARLFSAYRYVHFIANRRLLTSPADLQIFTSKVALQMSIPKKICVWISNNIDVPATIGFLKPVILIPVASINSLTTHQLEAIILHELSHIKRNDYITNLVISVIETILFFNPFIALLSKIVKRERENCCDDFVIQYQYDPHSYASALLRLEQTRRTNVSLSLGAVSGKKQLLTRIKRITNNEAVTRQFNYGQKLLSLILVTGIICSIAWLSPGGKKEILNYSTKNIKQAVLPGAPVQNILPEPISEVSPAIINAHKEIQQKDHKRSLLSPLPPPPSLINTPLENGNKEIEMKDFLKAKQGFFDKDFYSKNARLFFDQKNIKFAPFKNIPNFPLQNLKINIDIEALNKDLRKASEEINAIDWKKIQNDVKQSLSRIKTDELTKIKLAELEKENANFQEIRNLKKEEISREIFGLLKKKLLLKDSVEMAMALSNVDNLTTENWQEDQKNQNLSSPEKNESSYNFTYVSRSAPKSNSKETPKSFRGNISISHLKDKNVNIIVEHRSSSFKHLYYSTEKGSATETNHQPLIKETNHQPLIKIVVENNNLP